MIDAMPPTGDPPAPVPARAPDPGSPLAARVAWAAMLLLTLGVVIMNQFVEPKAAKAAPEPAALTAPEFDEFTAMAKAMVKIAKTPVMKAEASAGAAVMPNIDQAARADAEKLRAAMVALELVSDKEATRRLDDLSKEVAKDQTPLPGLAEDIGLVRRVVEQGPEGLTQEERAGLEARHGWFGKLLLSHGLADSDPQRAALLGGGMRLLGIIGAFGAAACVAFAAGLALFIVALVRLSRGKLFAAFVRPAPGGSIFIETLAVFVFIFLVVLKIGLSVVAGMMKEVPEWFQTFGLFAQWLLVVVPLYPLLRGVCFADLRRRVGWHSGRGVMREIGAGLCGYLAGLPLLGLAFVGTVALVVIVQVVTQWLLHRNPEPPENHVAELITSSTPFQLVLLFTLATVWAPLVEESMFRGALYRQLRGRLGVLASAGISAFFFGVMHGYAFYLLLPVMTLGFVFALMREWRGSLIGPMVAHGLHNATVLSAALLLLGALKD